MRRLYGVVVICTSLTVGCARPHAAVEEKAKDVSLRYRMIDTQGPYEIHTTAVGDLNGDRISDVLAAGTDGNIFWYESPSWKKHTVTTKGGGWSTMAKIGDIDRDGDADFAISDWYQDKRLVWFENAGQDAWKMHPIGPPNAHDVELVDLDKDGDLDVVTRRETYEGASGEMIEIWLQDKPDKWKHVTLPCPAGEGLHVADVDQDGDSDIIISGRWYENTGAPDPGKWVEHVYTTTYDLPSAFPWLADINRDRVPDVVLTPAKPQGKQRYRLSWFEGRKAAGLWTEHIIADNLETLHHSIHVEDMDLDGDLDVITAEMHQSIDPDEVAIYLNDDGKGGRWRKQLVATTGSHFLHAADLDGDGDVDLVGANWAESRRIELWENLIRSK